MLSLFFLSFFFPGLSFLRHVVLYFFPFILLFFLFVVYLFNMWPYISFFSFGSTVFSFFFLFFFLCFFFLSLLLFHLSCCFTCFSFFFFSLLSLFLLPYCYCFKFFFDSVPFSFRLLLSLLRTNGMFISYFLAILLYGILQIKRHLTNKMASYK